MSLVAALGSIQSSPDAQGSGAPTMWTVFTQYGWVIPMAAVFYFLLIAPQRKQRKKMEEMLGGLKNGDRVLTTGGIHGTIVRTTQGDDAVRLRIAPTVEIDVARSAITSLLSESPKGS